MSNTAFIIILIVISIIILAVWATLRMCEQSKKDWATLKDLQIKAGKIKTKEEIEIFYQEFCEKAMKIDNATIYPYLVTIQGYVRGLYQQYI